MALVDSSYQPYSLLISSANTYLPTYLLFFPFSVQVKLYPYCTEYQASFDTKCPSLKHRFLLCFSPPFFVKWCLFQIKSKKYEYMYVQYNTIITTTSIFLPYLRNTYTSTYINSKSKTIATVAPTEYYMHTVLISPSSVDLPSAKDGGFFYVGNLGME